MLLRKHNQFFLSALFGADMLLTAAFWVLSGYVWLETGLVDLLERGLIDPLGLPIMIDRDFPDPSEYFHPIPLILIIAAFIYNSFGLYRPRRTGQFMLEAFDVVKASAMTILVLIFINMFFRNSNYSRGVGLLFAVGNTAQLLATRYAIRGILRKLRAAGRNLRHVLVIGDGRLAAEFAARVDGNPWTGLKIVGFVAHDGTASAPSVPREKIVGTGAELDGILDRHPVDSVFIALPFDMHDELESVLSIASDRLIDVKIVSDVLSFETLNHSVSNFDGLPILSLVESPLVGWNRIVKRLFDVTFAACFIAAFSWLYALLALLVKLSSRGPIFYRQERTGLDGKNFQILKFRSMPVDAEAQTGPVWAAKNDGRPTPIGAIMRATSLDEIPQFFNVLMGHMSIVGPRPERPVFIRDFRKNVPKYMLRHKVRAGITGWAQINGFRGNTSLEKRIQYDLYYIENYSIWFDLFIIVMTPFNIRKNAY